MNNLPGNLKESKRLFSLLLGGIVSPLLLRRFEKDWSRGADMPIHFFTLVLNGMPFIERHIDVFAALDIPWKWHIVEGLADLKHDTAWSVGNGGRITESLHNNGLSNDGTTEYIDRLAASHKNVFVHRKPSGQLWDGKVEMCKTFLSHVNEPCLIWQVDVDEFWTVGQIRTVFSLFRKNPARTAAWFFCRFFVGARLATITRNTYANNPRVEWLRVWRYRPGMTWASHEPPVLLMNNFFDVGKLNPFSHHETEKNNLVFDHYAYVVPKQLEFKEIYYGYKDAFASWKRLQQCEAFPVYLRDFLPWVQDATLVDLADGFPQQLADNYCKDDGSL
jgi:hypothetical protein